MESELPFGIKRPPQVEQTKAALCVVDDHLTKSDVVVETWWSGEGITLHIYGKDGQSQEIDMSWQEWKAARLCVEAVTAD